MALALKYSSPLELQVSNEKYSFSVYILRLGFIGGAFKASRKALLDKLNGDGAFRQGKGGKMANNSVAV